MPRILEVFDPESPGVRSLHGTLRESRTTAAKKRDGR
jgi:hypothetical protein